MHKATIFSRVADGSRCSRNPARGRDVMSNARLPVIIAGAGPVGMVAAADLARQNIPVLVLEKNDALSRESQASTFHPPTLDMLDDLGFASALIAQGLKAPTVQYSTSQDGVLGTFDF